MNGRDSFKRCRKCGKMIGIIRERAYRKILVDAEAVLVMPDTTGEIFIELDGRKIKGREADFEEKAAYGVPGGPEYAYRPHRCGASEDEM